MPSDHNLLILSYQDKKIFANKAVANWEGLLWTVSQTFGLAAEEILLSTDDLDICKGDFVQLTPQTYDRVISLCSRITVSKIEAPKAADELALSFPTASSPNGFQFTVRTQQGKDLFVTGLTPRYPIFALQMWLWGSEAIPLSDQQIFYQTKELEENAMTFEQYNIPNGALLHLIRVVKFAKPVIYLQNPEELDASVSLSLTKEWTFSAIYPVVPVKGQDGEKITWDVRTRKDGSLVQNDTGLEVSYLYWEAETTKFAFPPSPPLSPVDQVDRFSPLTAKLDDENSVLLSLKDLPRYLNRTLTALGLHTEARTSFITYWLPSLNKHKYIALRFIPQVSYESAAPLDISPQPDVVTRVFMIFKGVGDISQWPSAVQRAGQDVVFWRDIIGVDVAATTNAGLFRVLEWGGMEVFH
ncbi:hypothetical protein C8J56DRAFT_928596 [Mycena floridula]|nr:hypothetical protein C8J56DRAFT_928596 [Mycena floridula]